MKGEGSHSSPIALFGRYRLGRLLGSGGMAEVFRAVRTGAGGFERPVCVKRILPSHVRDEEFRELFLREIRIAGELSHGNIVQVFDCVQEELVLAIVMELIDGMDLRELSRRLRKTNRELDEGTVAFVAGQVLNGLRYAHGRRLIHRDISPHNVLVSRHGEVKLADFGVAKVLHTMGTATDDLKGKLPYMSPEQVRNTGVDYRSDLYSAGLVFYELLQGERFFNAPGLDMVGQIAGAKRPRLTGRSPELAALVEGLLEPDVTKRFQTAAAALAALPRWKESGPAGAVRLARLVNELRPAAGTDRKSERGSQPSQSSVSSEVVRGRDVPSSLIRDVQRDQDDGHRGNTFNLQRDLGHRLDHPVVAATPNAPTAERDEDVQQAVAVAPTMDDHVAAAPSAVGHPPQAVPPFAVPAPGHRPGAAESPPESPQGASKSQKLLAAAGVVFLLALGLVIGGFLLPSPRGRSDPGDGQEPEPPGEPSAQAAPPTGETPTPEDQPAPAPVASTEPAERPTQSAPPGRCEGQGCGQPSRPQAPAEGTGSPEEGVAPSGTSEAEPPAGSEEVAATPPDEPRDEEERDDPARPAPRARTPRRPRSGPDSDERHPREPRRPRTSPWGQPRTPSYGRELPSQGTSGYGREL